MNMMELARKAKIRHNKTVGKTREIIQAFKIPILTKIRNLRATMILTAYLIRQLRTIAL